MSRKPTFLRYTFPSGTKVVEKTEDIQTPGDYIVVNERKHYRVDTNKRIQSTKNLDSYLPQKLQWIETIDDVKHPGNYMTSDGSYWKVDSRLKRTRVFRFVQQREEDQKQSNDMERSPSSERNPSPRDNRPPQDMKSPLSDSTVVFQSSDIDRPGRYLVLNEKVLMVVTEKDPESYIGIIEQPVYDVSRMLPEGDIVDILDVSPSNHIQSSELSSGLYYIRSTDSIIAYDAERKVVDERMLNVKDTKLPTSQVSQRIYKVLTLMKRELVFHIPTVRECDDEDRSTWKEIYSTRDYKHYVNDAFTFIVRRWPHSSKQEVEEMVERCKRLHYHLIEFAPRLIEIQLCQRRDSRSSTRIWETTCVYRGAFDQTFKQLGEDRSLLNKTQTTAIQTYLSTRNIPTSLFDEHVLVYGFENFAQVLNMVRQLGTEKGMVHGNCKPSRVVQNTTTGTWRLVDWYFGEDLHYFKNHPKADTTSLFTCSSTREMHKGWLRIHFDQWTFETYLARLHPTFLIDRSTVDVFTETLYRKNRTIHDRLQVHCSRWNQVVKSQRHPIFSYLILDKDVYEYQ